MLGTLDTITVGTLKWFPIRLSTFLCMTVICFLTETIAWCVFNVYTFSLLYNKFTTGRWVYLIIGEVTESLTEVIIYFAVTAFIIPFMCLLIGHKTCSWLSSMFKL